MSEEKKLITIEDLELELEKGAEEYNKMVAQSEQLGKQIQALGQHLSNVEYTLGIMKNNQDISETPKETE